MILSKREQKGFTLIELMIVVAIIGILAAIAIPQFSNYRKRAANAAAMSDAKNLATAQEVYYTDNNTYASDTADLEGAGFVGFSKGVRLVEEITVDDDEDTWSATLKHDGGTKEYTVSGPGGSITPDSPAP
ncbi:MAG TPA: prepilin-type N-terminal cleavage/methylation domain-containing protein [Desulfobacteraceae bacterium]|nr:prepilin-type N-terminal cleavage/methylation domain-containing protein [Desulfobacteraceae bacterium]